MGLETRQRSSLQMTLQGAAPLNPPAVDKVVNVRWSPTLFIPSHFQVIVVAQSLDRGQETTLVEVVDKGITSGVDSRRGVPEDWRAFFLGRHSRACSHRQERSEFLAHSLGQPVVPGVGLLLFPNDVAGVLLAVEEIILLLFAPQFVHASVEDTSLGCFVFLLVNRLMPTPT